MAIKKYQPDYIIPFLDAMVYETFLAAIGIKAMKIATVRNIPTDNGKIRNLLTHIAFAKSDAIWLQTEEQKKYLSLKMQKKTFVVPNPITDNLIESHTYKNEKKIIITCGRLDKQKNHDLLIEAMEQVHAQQPELILKIYGEGRERTNLENKIESISAQKYIQLMGRTENIKEVLRETDLFVLSSDYEGLPNALMEAMAMGVPCISTKCPTGPKELLGEDERGLLVPIKDGKALADAIIRLCNEPDKAKEYGKKAQKYIEMEYRIEKIMSKLISNINLEGKYGEIK